MTVTARRARILRLRTIESRIAKTRLTQVEAALGNLLQIAQRLDALGTGLGTTTGATNGQMLLAGAEMTLRLENAAAAIVAPVKEAQDRRDESANMWMRARQKEQGAEKLHAIAHSQAEAARVLRADANRPFIKRKPYLESMQ